MQINQRKRTSSVMRYAFCAFLFLCALGVQAQAPKKQFRFIVYGDTRDGHEIHRKLINLMIFQKPAFVLQTGDLVHNGASENQWSTYDEITAPIRKIVPIYPARGNHDVGGPLYEAHVFTPYLSGNKLYHSFDYGNSHFVCLAIDEVTPFGPTSPQYKWLEKDLAAARSKARHIFAYFHVSPYSIGSHGSSPAVQDAICPLFVKYGVRTVFTGHDHLYYRTKRDNVLYIVTGGGGAPLYYPDPKKGAIEGDKWERVNHMVVCDVDGDSVTYTIKRADGSNIESFSVAR